MEFTAKANYMRVSPQKARLVLDMIKGRRVEDALNVLEFTNKRIAPVVHKLLRSAVENEPGLLGRRAHVPRGRVCLDHD